MTTVNKDYGTYKVRGLAVPGAGLPFGPYQGDSYFVDPTNGSDSNDGRTIETAKATLAAGEDLLTANQNDTLYYLAGSSSDTLAAAGLTWDKNYTHLVGVAAPTRIAQRSRVFLNSASTATSMITVSATGCSFRNMYFFHGVASTSSLYCLTVTGGRNYFENVHVAGIGHATGQGDVANAASLYLNGAEECTFKDCTIGVDTIARSTTNAEVELVGAANRNQFVGCTFLSFADNAGHLFVKIDGSGDIDRFVLFRDCVFMNTVESTGTTMTAAMNVHNTAGGLVLLHNSQIVGATDVAAADNGNVWVDGAGGAGTGGLAIVATQ